MVCLFWVGLAEAEVVDGVLHVVGERIVTRSDVAFEADVDPHDTSPLAALENSAYPLERRLVDFAVLRELAGDTEIYRPSPSEVRARWERFRAGWANPEEYPAFLARWGLDDDQLLGFFYSRLVVERYVARNAAQAAAGLSKEEITAELYQAWMAELRARADVRSAR